MLRELAPGAFLLVFLICLTSFAVALALGGGPRATTVELAIYQAFRFDFDMGRAAALALLQFALCLGAGVAGAARRAALWAWAAVWTARCLRMDYRSHAAWGDSLLVTLAALVPAGAAGADRAARRARIWPACLHLSGNATIRSLWVALGATALTIGFALVLAHAILALPRAGAMGLEWLGLAALAASALGYRHGGCS